MAKRFGQRDRLLARVERDAGIAVETLTLFIRFLLAAADVPIRKFKLGQSELRSDVAKALVRDKLFLDGDFRQNLSTFFQTRLDPKIQELMDLSIDKNAIDEDDYPATAKIKKRRVNIRAVLALWNAAPRSSA